MKTEYLASGTARRLVVQHFPPIRLGLLALIALVFSACTPTGYTPPVGVPTRAVAEVASGEPAISIAPTSGSAGVYVQVTGENWPEGSLVLIAQPALAGSGHAYRACIHVRWPARGDRAIPNRRGRRGDGYDGDNGGAAGGYGNAHADGCANGHTNACPVGDSDDHACPDADAAYHHRLARRLLEQSKPVGTGAAHTQRSCDLLQLGRGNGCQRLGRGPFQRSLDTNTQLRCRHLSL